MGLRLISLDCSWASSHHRSVVLWRSLDARQVPWESSLLSYLFQAFQWLIKEEVTWEFYAFQSKKVWLWGFPNILKPGLFQGRLRWSPIEGLGGYQVHLGVAIRVHGAGSCRVGWYNSTIWVNPNTTRLLIVSWYVNPNTTRLLNGLTQHDSHNPFNKRVGLGWHDPTRPIWLELHKLTYTTHLTRITQIDLYSPFNPNSTNWLV